MFYITACPGHSRSPALARHSHRAALCLEPNVHSSMRQETQARRTFESHSRNIREIFSRRTGGSNTWDLTCSWQWPRSWRPLWPLGPSSGCFSAEDDAAAPLQHSPNNESIENPTEDHVENPGRAINETHRNHIKRLIIAVILTIPILHHDHGDARRHRAPPLADQPWRMPSSPRRLCSTALPRRTITARPP